MSRILVIQLERLGDLIQTTPLLQDLSTAAPKARIDLIVTAGNETVLPDLAAIDNVFTLPGEAVRSYGAVIESAMRTGDLEAAAKPVLEALVLPEYDRVINVSHEHLSAWLTARVDARDREGALIDAQGQWRYAGAAHAYLIALLDFRARNRFNLVDLYRSAAGALVPDKTARPQVALDVSMALPRADGPYVALNPGASRAWKQWPAAEFAELARLLQAQGLTPVLVGGPADRELCAAIVGLAGFELKNLAGLTSVPQMAGVLVSCALLVSNDTGAVHIAAAVGTPVLGLYGATYFAETAPWSAGNWLLQAPFRHEDADWSQLTAARVALAVAVKLGRAGEEELRTELQGTPVEIWETAFLPKGADPLGGLYYLPVIARQHTLARLDDHLRHLLANFFLAQSAEPLQTPLPPLTVPDSDTLCAALDSAFGHLHELAETAGSAARLSATRDAGQAAALRELTARLSVDLEALERISSEQPALSPLLHSMNWQLRMLPQGEPLTFFLEHMQIYHRMSALLVEIARRLPCAAD